MVKILKDEKSGDLFNWGLERLLTLDVNGKEIFVYIGGKDLRDELDNLAEQGYEVFKVNDIRVLDLPKGYGIWIAEKKVLWITDNISRDDVKAVVEFFIENKDKLLD
jgi:hypothetical protein